MNSKWFVCLFCLIFLVSVVSADTLIVYLSEDTADRIVGRTTASVFPTLRNGIGNYELDNSISVGGIFVAAATITTDYWLPLRRLGYGFNTSPLPDTATISDTVFSMWISQKGNDAGANDLGITEFYPATANSFVAEDYNKTGTSTRYTTDVPYASVVIGAYNNISFNNDGKSAINKTGYTNFIARFSKDIDNSNLTWASAISSYYYVSDYTENVSRQPILTITYTDVTAPVTSFTCDKNLVRIPNSVTCTDSSTNNPTSWSWNMGDGSAAVTTQNVTCAL